MDTLMGPRGAHQHYTSQLNILTNNILLLQCSNALDNKSKTEHEYYG